MAGCVHCTGGSPDYWQDVSTAPGEVQSEFEDELTAIATSIMEGHLRDSIAAMTPEQVMTDKDVLVQRMIKVCKGDLEGIGLEITAMNIADVEDHRLDGVAERSTTLHRPFETRASRQR
jgi:uncharacterized membrane protein YqiK